jgi:hypothetical protein
MDSGLEKNWSRTANTTVELFDHILLEPKILSVTSRPNQSKVLVWGVSRTLQQSGKGV